MSCYPSSQTNPKKILTGYVKSVPDKKSLNISFNKMISFDTHHLKEKGDKLFGKLGGAVFFPRFNMIETRTKLKCRSSEK